MSDFVRSAEKMSPMFGSGPCLLKGQKIVNVFFETDIEVIKIGRCIEEGLVQGCALYCVVPVTREMLSDMLYELYEEE